MLLIKGSPSTLCMDAMHFEDILRCVSQNY